MIIKTIHVKNFRSILDEKIDCEKLTVLVGRNGAGKSSFLKALELFYDPKANVTAEDFYAQDTSKEIEIALTFTDLDNQEKDLFKPYLDADELTLVRVFSLNAKKSGTYHGFKLQHPDFAEIRNTDSKTEIRRKYIEIIQQPNYSSLPSVRSADQVEEELRKWESANPNLCSRIRDDGQFFGFTEVGNGYLGRHTRFILIPAVRDASDDATEKKGSCVSEIMDLVVRRTLAERDDFKTLKEETQKKYREIMEPIKRKELSELQAQLSKTLQQYAPEAGVSMEWAQLDEIDLPMPKAEIRLHEDGYKSSVQRTGHGLQRAFIMTMLQNLVTARSLQIQAKNNSPSDSELSKAEGEASLPSFLLAIEEPELYQHPSRQRHIASVLRQLAQGAIPGVAKQMQIIYTTHSPLFVGLDRFEQIRLARKVYIGPEKPKVTKIFKADLDAVAEEILNAGNKQGDKFTADTLRTRLQALMTPWVNEGFFADVVVLVEGDDDRASILGVAASMGYPFDSYGISVIPCNGKNNLDRPLVIFRKLGIPVYVVWDNDDGKDGASKDANRRLLRLLGRPEEEDCSKDIVEDNYACFKDKLETTLQTEIGPDLFNQLALEVQKQFGFQGKNNALKNPVVLQGIIDKASAHDKVSPTLKGIVEKILALITQQRGGQ